MSVDSYLLCFFFFQAEDGIRDGTVTGVQTCALPICHRLAGPVEVRAAASRGADDRDVEARRVLDDGHRQVRVVRQRSEERRVGKECRSRWSQYHEKK